MIKKIIEKITSKKDESPEPKMDYVVGVSTGMPRQYPTLAGRLGYSVMKGTEFIELMVEHPVALTKKEIDEINLVRKRLGVTLGMHGGLDVYITSPCDIDYKDAEKKLNLYIDAGAKIKAKYINFHASVLAIPRMYPIPRRYDFLVDENGDNIIKKISDKTPKLKEWFINIFLRDIFGRSITVYFPREILLKMDALEKAVNRKEISMEEFEKKYEELKKEGIDKAMETFKKDIHNQPWRDHGVEDWAFEIMGRWMHETKDPLWKAYCGNKGYEDVEEEKAIAAVSARYVAGHLKKFLEKLEEKNVIITLESPDARGGQYAGYYRLQSSTEIYHVVKHINSPYVRILIDFEHEATQGIDPLKDLEKAPSDLGKYVLTLHVGTIPVPAHTHAPSPRGDVYLYKLIWTLRQKGFEHGIFIFERGGYEEPRLYEQIVITLKDIAKYLTMDIPPDELPDEFFGLTPAEMEHEKRVVKSHAFDPIQGMFELPELNHTWLGKEAMEKKRVRPETWKKEEHR
ncbi:MAG: hypothetical protein J7K87_03095 [Candidatus Aenigmarchaeota archaeon]|nr:hypothetical protein [Candidatus Aenigmarchaeota archaeon]